jgi:hypothetical protein
MNQALKMEGKMNRKNNIGLGNGFHSSPSLSFALVTVCCLLVAGFMLLFAPCVMAADKLIVKDLDGNNKFVVTDEGKVGVGTTTPEESLDIVASGDGFIRVADITEDNTTKAARIVLRHFSNSEEPVYLFGVAADAANNYIAIGGAASASNANAATQISFFTAPTNTTTYGYNRLIIKGNGNIGIGTTAPQGKLDVNGSIYQRGSSLHADYVFEPTYKIESIEEHTQYMWANKHLSAVPGVCKDENGLEIVEVGSHQRGILEELEKAHVYIAQLSDRIKTLETKLKALGSGK